MRKGPKGTRPFDPAAAHPEGAQQAVMAMIAPITAMTTTVITTIRPSIGLSHLQKTCLNTFQSSLRISRMIFFTP